MKKREEMSIDELREALIIDCKKVTQELDKLIEKGLADAPEVLLKSGDAFIILAGALAALESQYFDFLEQKKENAVKGIPDKKNYN